MAFEDRAVRRQRVRYNDTNDDNKLVYPFTSRGEKTTPTSATIAIYAPGNTTAVLTATAMTVNGTLLEYVLDTSADTSTWKTQNGYRADVVITDSGAVTHNRHFLFDIVPYILNVNVTRDLLVSIDDNLKAMKHNDDEDFSPLINFAKDRVQLKLESKVVREKKLLQDMILDASGVEMAVAYKVLEQHWHNKKDSEARDYYKGEFNELMASLLSTLKFDDSLDGNESNEIGGVHEVRLVT